jgi:hypothetical protein
MKFTIICGNPVDGYECYGIFDSEVEAINWANDDAHLTPDWWVMAITTVGLS